MLNYEAVMSFKQSRLFHILTKMHFHTFLHSKFLLKAADKSRGGCLTVQVSVIGRIPLNVKVSEFYAMEN